MGRDTKDLASRAAYEPWDRSQFDWQVWKFLPIQMETDIRNRLLASSSVGVTLLGFRQIGLSQIWIRALLWKNDFLHEATYRNAQHLYLACRSTRSRSVRTHEYGRWSFSEWSHFEMPFQIVPHQMGVSCEMSEQYLGNLQISPALSQDGDRREKEHLPSFPGESRAWDWTASLRPSSWLHSEDMRYVRVSCRHWDLRERSCPLPSYLVLGSSHLSQVLPRWVYPLDVEYYIRDTPWVDQKKTRHDPMRPTSEGSSWSQHRGGPYLFASGRILGSRDFWYFPWGVRRVDRSPTSSRDLSRSQIPDRRTLWFSQRWRV